MSRVGRLIRQSSTALGIAEMTTQIRGKRGRGGATLSARFRRPKEGKPEELHGTLVSSQGVPAVVVGLGVLSSCGAGTYKRRAATVRPGVRAIAAPIGSPSNPAALSCQQEADAGTGVRVAPRRGDLIVGPLSFPNGLRLATANPRSYGSQGSSYKLPPVLAPGSTVTITIAPSAHAYVVMSNPYLNNPNFAQNTRRAWSPRPTTPAGTGGASLRRALRSPTDGPAAVCRST